MEDVSVMAEPKDVELRGSVTRSFLQKLDAVAQSEGVGRIEWLLPVVERELDRRIHAARMLVSMCGSNPAPSDEGRE